MFGLLKLPFRLVIMGLALYGLSHVPIDGTPIWKILKRYTGSLLSGVQSSIEDRAKSIKKSRNRLLKKSKNRIERIRERKESAPLHKVAPKKRFIKRQEKNEKNEEKEGGQDRLEVFTNSEREELERILEIGSK